MYETVSEYLKYNRLLAISTPVYATLIILEVVISNYQRKHFYSVKETLINFWLNIANTIIGLAVKVLVLALLGWFFTFHFIPVSFWSSHPVLYWILLFFGLDLCFYFEHRSEHYSRVLWAVHVTHHSSQEYNLTTGFRSSVFRPLVSCWFFIPLVFLGFQPLDILLMDAFCQIYGIIVHTRYVNKMPAWFDAVFVSPSHHRVHHASNVIYLDKNMGMVLIIWDRLFGTFQRELDTEKAVYGLTRNVERPHHPFHIIFHEWKNLFRDVRRKNLSFAQVLHYLFDAPGWSHDGSSKTARQMREEAGKNEN